MDKKHKIYSKKAALTPAFHLPLRKENGDKPSAGTRPTLPMSALGRRDLAEGGHGELNAQREADRITVNQFAPPSVLVNADLQVLQFRGPTGAFLEPPTGNASFDVLKMAREGLMLPLRSAITEAKRDNKSARKDNVHLNRDGTTRAVNLEVIPLKNLPEPCFLILFEEAENGGRSARRVPTKLDEPSEGVASLTAEQEASRIAELKTEIAETREYLQSVQEQHEAANEELQAANEEVQSANEELQSVNEELETSKEELESANEELTTVNEEMSNRNVELNRVNNDLTNFQASTKLPIVLLGRDLTIRRFSPQAEKQFDLLITDMGRPIGHIRHDLLVGDSATPLDLESLSAEVISEVREEEREVRDNRGRWYLLRVRPYLTGDNKLDGAVLVLVDVTARKRAEEVPARLAAIVTSSDDAILSTDLQGIIQTWNDGATRLYGFAEAEAVGKPTTLLIPPDRLGEESEILERVRHGEIVNRFESMRERKDGSRVSVSLTFSPVRDAAGRVIAASIISRDITDRKRMEDKLRKDAADLVQADYRKNEFLAMLGHELRNPLSAVMHGLDLQGKLSDDHARSEELRVMMFRHAKRVGILLDQLLDVSRVVSGKLHLSRDRVDLAQVVLAAIETVRPLVEAQKHQITVTLPPEEGAFVMGDDVRLTQVVENLVTNAVKYTDPGGRIEVALEWAHETVRLVVRDTGIGMSAEFLPQIFDVFTQAGRSLDRAQGGLGLGLTLVRRLVEMHGGRVEAASLGLEQGSEFIVTLPLVRERRSKERINGERAEPGNVRHYRIMVVDDEADVGEAFAALLEADGHQVMFVNDGAAALEAAPKFDPEVVLLDLGLPEMDGYEVARRFRKAHGDKKILLIAVTGYQSDTARLKGAGFDQHLIKPTNLQKLAAVLAAWDRPS